MYDFANSGYTTVVLTTVFNAYFVGIVAPAAGYGAGAATFLWTLAIGLGNLIVLLSAPLVGAFADLRAAKKKLLVAASLGCVSTTALLATVSPGDAALAMVLVVASLVCFETGENLIAAFLPEIVSEDRIGRMSGYGWGLGYLGGLVTLALCFLWISVGAERGLGEAELVPGTLLLTAGIFLLAALPTLLVLRDRARVSADHVGFAAIAAAWTRLRQTFENASAHRDLFRFLLALVVFQSGVATVIVLAAVYARAEFDLGSRDLVLLVMVVNVAAAAGALCTGFAQDRFGSVRTLAGVLGVWICALAMLLFARDVVHLWIAAHVVGFAMGGSQSAGRALVGLFAPRARHAEFFGLWGLANRLASILGPLTYGVIAVAAAGNQRTAIASTVTFFVVGLALLLRVDERSGIAAAASASEPPQR
jgi:UMF1 family MFS transporter